MSSVLRLVNISAQGKKKRVVIRKEGCLKKYIGTWKITKILNVKYRPCSKNKLGSNKSRDILKNPSHAAIPRVIFYSVF